MGPFDNQDLSGRKVYTLSESLRFTERVPVSREIGGSSVGISGRPRMWRVSSRRDTNPTVRRSDGRTLIQ